MAHGFSSAAVGQLGEERVSKDDVSAIMRSQEKGDSVEIVALSEELSQQAAQILERRRKQTNPVTAYMRNVQCDTAGEVDGGEPRKPTKPPGSPLWRLTLQTFPIFSWFPALDFKLVRQDIVAGLTVGVMVIPQSMSYANIAGLDYIYGMYSACVPTLVYGFFGQSRQLAVGPVAMVSLLVEAGLRDKISPDMAKTDSCKAWFVNDGGLPQSALCRTEYAELAMLVSVAVGVMQIAGSILKLGFLVSFLGHPVTSGFTSGAAIIIGLSQVKYWLGIKVAKSQFVYVTLGEMFKHVGDIKFMPLILGLFWFAALFTNKKMSAKYKVLKNVGPLGPLVSCVVGILLTWSIPTLRDDYHVDYVGFIPDGLFPVSIGKLPFSHFSEILPTALSACLIGYMESVAIGKNLAARNGYEIDAGQEMLALGVSNLVGGCFSCYPVAGSFSRSAVAQSTGGKTQLAGLISAVIMFLTLMFLTPLFWFLPQFALASIVINSIIPLVAFGEAKKLYHIKKNDFVLWVVAFLGTMLLGVLLGICLAVLLSLSIVIYESVRPQITILWRIPGTTIYRNVKQESSGAFIPNVFICRIGSSLYFANVSFVKDMLLAYASDLEDINRTEYIVLEMTSVISIDSTAVHVIQDIVSEFRNRGIQVAFAMVGNRVEKTMRKARLWQFIGQQWFFPTVDQAVLYSLRHQHIKRQKSGEIAGSQHALEVDSTKVHVGNEIGFSNELNHGYTTVFISLVIDIPLIKSDIDAVFKSNNIAIIKANFELFNVLGAKHTYFVKSIKKDSKLSEYEIERVREELGNAINSKEERRRKSSHERLVRLTSTSKDGLAGEDTPVSITSSPKLSFHNSPVIGGRDPAMIDPARIKRLEDALLREQDSNQKLQKGLESQTKRLDNFLSRMESGQVLGNQQNEYAEECDEDGLTKHSI